MRREINRNTMRRDIIIPGSHTLRCTARRRRAAAAGTDVTIVKGGRYRLLLLIFWTFKNGFTYSFE